MIECQGRRYGGRHRRERIVLEKYIRLTHDMSWKSTETKVRSVAGERSNFGVKVELHKGCLLTSYVFLPLVTEGDKRHQTQ